MRNAARPRVVYDVEEWVCMSVGLVLYVLLAGGSMLWLWLERPELRPLVFRDLENLFLLVLVFYTAVTACCSFRTRWARPVRVFFLLVGWTLVLLGLLMCEHAVHLLRRPRVLSGDAVM